MPTYDFDCPKCQRIEEITVPSFGTELTCKVCGGPLHRMFSPPDPSRAGTDHPVSGPSRAELWQAYKDHKIRFRVDADPNSPTYGNDITEVVDTGEKVPSNSFDYHHLREAYDPPPKRDAEGRPIRRDRTGRRIWPEESKKFFMGGS